MEKILMFIIAFVFLAAAVLLLMGKADFLLSKYRLSFREGKLKFVKIREYDKAVRPFMALLLFLISLNLVLVYFLPAVAEYFALALVGICVPLALFMEFKYRKR